MQVFSRDPDGHLVVTMHALDARAFATVAADLRALIGAPGEDDPVQRRLFPEAYTDPTEEDAEREWQAMVRPDLTRSRIAALDAVRARFEQADPQGDVVRVVLDAEGEATLLGALNDMRLALGAALGVTADTDLDAATPGDPLALFNWLGALEAELVDLLLDELPG